MAKDYSEDLLLQKSTAELLEKELGWKSVYAFDNEVLGEQGTLGRKSQGDVLVTPGISECEKRIKNECLQERYPLIHIQDKPIGQYWKPEKSRFEACVAGTLLILAPWQEDQNGDSDYARFHNLNSLAAAICSLDVETAMKITTS